MPDRPDPDVQAATHLASDAMREFGRRPDTGRIAFRPRPFPEAVRYALGLPADAPDEDVITELALTVVIARRAEGKPPR